ncbi:putative RNA-directed DNA polymerase from transposon X-element [Trichonephila clavipes]|nr:putative RNA-directed DNA polymerase from transposon X-element [Trichonephila clavipes]
MTVYSMALWDTPHSFIFGLRGNLPIFIQKFLNVRTFKVRLGDTLSASLQAEGVPQGSILSVTLFICHISPILNALSPSIQASFYVDDLQISCEGSDMRMIERQLQTAVNNILKMQGFRYRVLLATKSRRNHRQRASGQRGKVGDDPSAACSSGLSDMRSASSCIIFFMIWQECHGVSSWITNCTL